MLKNKKLIYALTVILVIIIAGIVMLFTKGINYGLEYGKNTTVEIYLETDFEYGDIKNVIEETFGSDIKIKQINGLKNDIVVLTKSASEEQLNNLISKVNEKYSTTLKVDDLIVNNNEKITIIDLIKPYILPVCITIIGILIYLLVAYKKIGSIKISLYFLATILITQLIYASLYIVLRLPVNNYTMPISILIYLLSILGIIIKLEKEKDKYKEEQK